MKIVVIFFILTSCALHLPYNYQDYVKPETVNEEIKVKTDIQSDSLMQIVSQNEIDSLCKIIEEQTFLIDSLQIALEISNSRVAVNTNFVIPDSIEFAGRMFDLTSERTYEKFQTIYKQELRSAHRFIPRSGKYFTYFDSVFSAYHIPLDVKYLAIAESRLSPFAGSRVGALGIWQFMPKTAKGYGMKIDSFVDERKNVFKSTVAAAKYLQNAYNILSRKGAADWLLAMSAYNAGVGSISKVIREQNAIDFFDILMRVDETNNYVWRAVAIKLIMENQPEIFGKTFELQKSIMHKNRLVNLKLKGYYEIDEWVKAHNANFGEILELNPWLKIYKRQRKKYSAVNNVVLPPGEYSVLIPNRMPNEEATQIEQEFLNENAGYFTHHTVKKGDNLSKIAVKYKTTVAKIKSLNALQSNIIYPGQKLKLFGQTQKNKFHIVKKGETLSNIASKYKITVAKLKKINNLKSNVIYPGDKLHY